MEMTDVMQVLEDMKVGIFATVDKEGSPHSRPIHITAAREEGVFFMTSSETQFYQQLMGDERVALTAFSEEDYLIQVIRIEGKARPAGLDLLEKVFADNPYVQHVYRDEESRKTMQIFQLYQGEGFYHSLTQGHKYSFRIQDGEGATVHSV